MTRRVLSLAADLRALLDAARDAGAYLVGGSLRDLLLDRPIADLDLAVADGPACARALAGRLAGHFVLLDAERGVARVALDDGPVRAIDVASFRGGAIDRDLGARDFSIDAIAAPVDALAVERAVDLIDPHGGLRDLEARVVRLVSEQALIDDPLRLLRAVRLATQLDFELAPETAAAVRRHAGRSELAAAERRRDELARCFATPRAARALRLMDGLGLLERLLPEVTAGRGVSQPREHYYDVLDHNIETVAALDWICARHDPEDAHERARRRAFWDALDGAGLRDYLDAEMTEGRSRSALLKLAALLHDVAKPETRAPDATGRIRFFGHAELGAGTARDVLRRLRFGRREVDFVATLVEEHLRPGQLGQAQGGLPTRRALYRFFRDLGEAAEGVLLLSLADALAARGPGMDLERWRGHVAYVAHVLARRDEEETIVRPPRLLTGHDVMAALGIGPGPAVGRLLRELEEAHASGDVADREQALEFVRRRHTGRARSCARRDARSAPRVSNAAPRERTLASAGGPT